jgi:heptosyltransferase-2
MKRNFQKILIVHSQGIGDLVMYTPALRVLSENFPRAAIDIFIGYSPVVGDVLREGKIVNKILRFSWREHGLLENLKFINKLRKEKYDL